MYNIFIFALFIYIMKRSRSLPILGKKSFDVIGYHSKNTHKTKEHLKLEEAELKSLVRSKSECAANILHFESTNNSSIIASQANIIMQARHKRCMSELTRIFASKHFMHTLGNIKYPEVKALESLEYTNWISVMEKIPHLFDNYSTLLDSVQTNHRFNLPANRDEAREKFYADFPDDIKQEYLNKFNGNDELVEDKINDHFIRAHCIELTRSPLYQTSCWYNPLKDAITNVLSKQNNNDYSDDDRDIIYNLTQKILGDDPVLMRLLAKSLGVQDIPSNKLTAKIKLSMQPKKQANVNSRQLDNMQNGLVDALLNLRKKADTKATYAEKLHIVLNLGDYNPLLNLILVQHSKDRDKSDVLSLLNAAVGINPRYEDLHQIITTHGRALADSLYDILRQKKQKISGLSHIVLSPLNIVRWYFAFSLGVPISFALRNVGKKIKTINNGKNLNIDDVSQFLCDLPEFITFNSTVLRPLTGLIYRQRINKGNINVAKKYAGGLNINVADYIDIPKLLMEATQRALVKKIDIHVNLRIHDYILFNKINKQFKQFIQEDVSRWCELRTEGKMDTTSALCSDMIKAKYCTPFIINNWDLWKNFSVEQMEYTGAALRYFTASIPLGNRKMKALRAEILANPQAWSTLSAEQMRQKIIAAGGKIHHTNTNVHAMDITSDKIYQLLSSRCGDRSVEQAIEDIEQLKQKLQQQLNTLLSEKETAKLTKGKPNQAYKIKTAIRFLEAKHIKNDESEQKKLLKLLALVIQCHDKDYEWTEGNTNDDTTTETRQENILNSLIDKIYECQRAYNINTQDKDNGKKDDPSCYSGTCNRIALSLTSFIHMNGIPSKADYQAELQRSIPRVLIKYVSTYHFDTPKMRKIQELATILRENMQQGAIQEPLLSKDIWLIIKNDVRREIKSYYLGLQENAHTELEEKLWADIEDSDFFDAALSLMALPIEFMQKMHIFVNVDAINEEEKEKNKANAAKYKAQNQARNAKLFGGIDMEALKRKQEQRMKDYDAAEKD